MRFIDPDGMFTVEINGDKADDATKQLQASTSLKLSRDEKTGQLSATGEAKTDADKTLQAAINDKNVDVQINATSSNYTNDGHWFVEGAFGGSKTNSDGTTVATQTVNPDQTKAVSNLTKGQAGVAVLHETLEAYIGAKDHPGTIAPTFDDVKNKTPNSLNYVDAHNKAVALDPRFTPPNASQGPDGIYVSKFPYNPNLPPALNPEILLFQFRKP